MWRKYDDEVKMKKIGYTMIIDAEPYNGKYGWRISKGYIQYANGTAPSVDQAKKDALYWVWEQESTHQIIQCLVDDGLLSWSMNVTKDLIAWAKTIKDDPYSVGGGLAWVTLYADHLKEAQAVCP